MLAGPHKSHSPCLLSSSLFFTKHHDLHLPRTPQRIGPIHFRRPLVLPTCPGDPLCQCQQRYCRPPLRSPLHRSSTKLSLYIGRCADTPLFQSAAPGDTVSFKFHPKNHTVTQSSFDAPCTPLYGGTDTGLCVLSSIEIYLTRVFSDAFISHSVPVTLGTSDNDLPSREFIVQDVRVPFKY
jgi:hypothetical protein